MKGVNGLELGRGEQADIVKADGPGQGFSERALCEIEELDVFRERSATVALSDIR